MGTNYYLERNVCSECGRPHESLHIGKSSVGWCFSLHVIPDRGINDLDDWIQEFRDHRARIVDEYGSMVGISDMLATIRNRYRRPPPPQL